MIDLILLLVGAFFAGAVFIVLVVGKPWQHRIEKTPSGFFSNKVMVFESPPGAKHEFFKEGNVEGKHAVWLEGDFDQDEPTFFARSRHDFEQTGELENGVQGFACRLTKQGYPDKSIIKEDWNAKYGVKETDPLGWDWFAEELKENVKQAQKFAAIKESDLKESIRKDHALASALIKQHELEWLLRMMKKRGRGTLPLLGQEGGEELGGELGSREPRGTGRA